MSWANFRPWSASNGKALGTTYCAVCGAPDQRQRRSDVAIGQLRSRGALANLPGGGTIILGLDERSGFGRHRWLTPAHPHLAAAGTGPAVLRLQRHVLL